MLKLFLLLLVNLQWYPGNSLNILGLFPYEGRSHFLLFEKYLLKLVEKGHNLTVVSHFPREEPIPLYHDISLAGVVDIPDGAFPMERSLWSKVQIIDYVVTSGHKGCKVMLENEAVQDLWKSKRKFDLIVMEYFNSDCAMGLAYKLEAPVLGLTPNDLMPWHHKTFGVPFNPTPFPSIFEDGFFSAVYERVEFVIVECAFRVKHAYMQKLDQEALGKYFDDLPPLDQLSQRMRYLLLYRNFVLSGSRLLPSNVIEVGGYHVGSSKPLPEDLQKFINESEHGVIYISFGFMLKESSLPKEKMDAILNAIAELPQRVIWKWNSEEFPGSLKKTYVSKWLPQNDLLAHPEVLAFFSHCGLLSTTEAVYHGIPVVALPVFEDQMMYAEKLVISGSGVKILLSDLTKDNLLSKFRTVLNSDFRRKAKSLSKAYKHRPVSAMDSAIFWTEFAADHNFTISSNTVMSPYHYYCVDTAVIFGIIFTVGLVAVFKVVTSLILVLREDEKVKRH